MASAVGDDLVEAANQRVDDLLAEHPLPPGHRGHFSYRLQLPGGDPLLTTVIDSS